MNRILTVGLILVLGLNLLAGCGGTPKKGITPPATSETIKAAPKWFLNPPQDPNYIFATGTATSRDMQLARDKASDAARMEIAKTVETRFNGLSKRFQEEVGTAEDAQYLDMFTQATKAVVSTVLSGVTIDQSELAAEGGVFRAYVLLKMPLGATSQALLNKIKQQEQLYTRFRASQVFDELEQETEAFEKWKSGQQP
ncbi:MAG: hypothetical protein FJY65_03520 [Calditrichaeota bacterium]|nr:hypothetical protein [Calditrichota bacterium]